MPCRNPNKESLLPANICNSSLRYTYLSSLVDGGVMATFGCATATMKFLVSLVTGNGGNVGENAVHTSSKSKGALANECRLKQADRNNTKGEAPRPLIWTQQPKGAHDNSSLSSVFQSTFFMAMSSP